MGSRNTALLARKQLDTSKKNELDKEKKSGGKLLANVLSADVSPVQEYINVVPSLIITEEQMREMHRTSPCTSHANQNDPTFIIKPQDLEAIPE